MTILTIIIYYIIYKYKEYLTILNRFDIDFFLFLVLPIVIKV